MLRQCDILEFQFFLQFKSSNDISYLYHYFNVSSIFFNLPSKTNISSNLSTLYKVDTPATLQRFLRVFR